MTTSTIKVTIPCDIHKIWEAVSSVERYQTWRNDVGKTEVTNEKQSIEYTPNGYPTTYTITKVEPHKHWELDVENSYATRRWTIVFESQDNETQIDFTASITAEQLSTRPVGKSVFEQTCLKRTQAQFTAGLKKALG